MNIPYVPASSHAVLAPPVAVMPPPQRHQDKHDQGQTAAAQPSKKNTAKAASPARAKTVQAPATAAVSSPALPPSSSSAAGAVPSSYSSNPIDTVESYLKHISQTKWSSLQRQQEEQRHRLETIAFQQRVHQQRQLATLQAKQSFQAQIPLDCVAERASAGSEKFMNGPQPQASPTYSSQHASRQTAVQSLPPSRGGESSLTDQDECALQLRKMFAEQMKQQQMANLQMSKPEKVTPALTPLQQQAENTTAAFDKHNNTALTDMTQLRPDSRHAQQSRDEAIEVPRPMPLSCASIGEENGSPKTAGIQFQDDAHLAQQMSALFHCYLIKYLRDAGLQKAASALSQEAGLSIDAKPPYNPTAAASGGGQQRGILFALFVAWWQRVHTVQHARHQRKDASADGTAARKEGRSTSSSTSAVEPRSAAHQVAAAGVRPDRSASISSEAAQSGGKANAASTASMTMLAEMTDDPRGSDKQCAQGFTSLDQQTEQCKQDKYAKETYIELAEHDRKNDGKIREKDGKDFVDHNSQQSSPSRAGSTVHFDENGSDSMSRQATSDTSRSDGSRSRQKTALARSQAAQQRVMQDMWRTQLSEASEAGKRSSEKSTAQNGHESRMQVSPFAHSNSNGQRGRSQDLLAPATNEQQELSHSETNASHAKRKRSIEDKTYFAEPCRTGHGITEVRKSSSTNKDSLFTATPSFVIGETRWPERNESTGQDSTAHKQKRDRPPDDVAQSLWGQSMLASQATPAAPHARPLQPHIDFEQTLLNIQLPVHAHASSTGTEAAMVFADGMIIPHLNTQSNNDVSSSTSVPTCSALYSQAQSNPMSWSYDAAQTSVDNSTSSAPANESSAALNTSLDDFGMWERLLSMAPPIETKTTAMQHNVPVQDPKVAAHPFHDRIPPATLNDYNAIFSDHSWTPLTEVLAAPDQRLPVADAPNSLNASDAHLSGFGQASAEEPVQR